MACEDYEVGILDAQRGHMTIKVWSQDAMVQNLRWLKRENVSGRDIFIRPNGPTGLVLVDDLTLGRLKELEAAGLTPCCVTRTSPENYQAWIRLADHPLEPKVLTAAAKLLARRFHGDPGSAAFRHFGRLAGFTNRKPKHVDENGKSPFVILEGGTGPLAPKGADLIAEAESALEAAVPAPRPKVSRAMPQPFTVPSDTTESRRYFLVEVERIQKARGTSFNASVADWQAASRMIEDGFSPEQIEDALRQSPNLEERKRGHLDHYVRLTLTKLGLGEA
jgi:hypothetical protein